VAPQMWRSVQMGVAGVLEGFPREAEPLAHSGRVTRPLEVCSSARPGARSSISLQCASKRERTL
jgi:hypothetical protein